MKYKNIIKLVLVVIYSFFLLSKGISQNLFFIGDKSYKIIEFQELTTKGESSFTELKVSIGKDGENGLIILSKNDFSRDLKISGELLIYLDDGSIIRCVDRGVRDRVNSTITTVYFLTASEVNRLKGENINTIRYSILRFGNIEARAAENVRKKFFISPPEIEKNRVDFPKLINNLFSGQ